MDNFLLLMRGELKENYNPLADFDHFIFIKRYLFLLRVCREYTPTNFFHKQDSQSEDEDIEIEDNESFLELVDKVISNNECFLGWHYRSRHQSLIAFSNHYFYDDALSIFASNSVGSEVKFHPVEEPNCSGGVNLLEVE